MYETVAHIGGYAALLLVGVGLWFHFRIKSLEDDDGGFRIGRKKR